MLQFQTHPSALPNLLAANQRARAHFEPPPDITISEWAIRNRILPRGTTSRPGNFIPEKYQIEMMDVILNPNVHEIVVKKSTQVGYSDAVLNNIVGYFIDADPKPLMMVQPTIDGAKDYGKKRITPMIDSCPVLRDKVRSATSRRAGNTLNLKEYPGGYLKLTGANSGNGLRSDPVPIVLLDEIDAYPLDVGGEGDPLAIATRRTDSFYDYKIFKGSTPAKPKGISPIDLAFLKSDQRHFHVPCPLCGFKQPLLWRDRDSPFEYRLTYEKGKDGVIRDSVAYVCVSCKGKIPERYKRQMLNAGEWIAKFPERVIVGFYINALYSPWREVWADLAQEWIDAQDDPEKLKAFINLRLGETWEEDKEAVEAETLRERVEKYEKDVPNGVGILTAAIDVQGDRLECVVKGWGAKEESWLISYQQFFGDPGAAQVWDEVDEFLRTEFEHVSGVRMRIRSAMIDSGGTHTDSVYRFVRPRQARHIFALKGSSEAGKEILGKYSLNNQYRVKLFTVGTDTAKDRILSRLKLPAPGPGYMHFPDEIEEEYFLQLTGEKAVRRYKKGRGSIREYVKTRSRNEALDLEVYNLCALYALGGVLVRNLGEMATRITNGIQGDAPAPPSGRAIRNPGIT